MAVSLYRLLMACLSSEKLNERICRSRVFPLYARTSSDELSSRRSLLAVCAGSTAAVVWKDCGEKGKASAEEALNSRNTTNVNGGDVLEGLLKLFDPNETTKSGKVLPKAYLKSAREVVKTLKESLQQESTQEAEIRRTADSAMKAIRDYLQNWKGQKAVASDDSYVELENALKVLRQFYFKEGPRAVLPSDIKTQILDYLRQAEAGL